MSSCMRASIPYGVVCKLCTPYDITSIRPRMRYRCPVAATRTTREAWVDEGLRALADGGPDAVRVEPLARALGVTKGGFYWQFEDRQALLVAMLETWEQTMVDEPVAKVEASDEDARAKLTALFALAHERRRFLRVELAVRDWARRDPSVARRLRRVDSRRMEFMRSLFREFCTDEDDVAVRCLVAFSLFLGSHLIAAHDRGRGRDEVLRLALDRLLADRF
jgi:AcrR family transcriptional regulator